MTIIIPADIPDGTYPAVITGVRQSTNRPLLLIVKWLVAECDSTRTVTEFVDLSDQDGRNRLQALMSAVGLPYNPGEFEEASLVGTKAIITFFSATSSNGRPYELISRYEPV